MLTTEQGREALRYTNTKLDGEIEATMAAALLDLQSGGVGSSPEADALIDQAVRLYLRWQFNFCGRGPEYEKAYKGLKDSMALSFGENEEENKWMKQSC